MSEQKKSHMMQDLWSMLTNKYTSEIVPEIAQPARGEGER